jgi:asparagine synthetase B (glutamine-hydrolysing)
MHATTSIIHRGPDAVIWKSDQYQLGLSARRLKIIDLSAAGKQPMYQS